MSKLKFSKKGQDLIKLYAQMAEEGYHRTDGQEVKEAFSDFELRPYRGHLREMIAPFSVSTVLDYGCGGSDWDQKGFHEDGSSAKEFFGLKEAYRYEPARNIDERQKVDCVLCFDVMEHIFISDVPNVLRDIFSCARKLVVLNIACYPAAAKLPNGENAHITVRPPVWWKGMVDSIAPEYPDVSINLICSTGWRKSSAGPIWSGRMWQESETFVVEK